MTRSKRQQILREARAEAAKGNHEVARLLFASVGISYHFVHAQTVKAYCDSYI